MYPQEFNSGGQNFLDAQKVGGKYLVNQQILY